MYRFTAEYLRETGIRIFTGCGSPPGEAEIVANELVEASLMGLDSHGVMRFAQYVEQTLAETVKPGARIDIVKETPNTALVDCGWNYGIVGAVKITEIACEKAVNNNISFITSRRCHHIGRLGSYVQKIAERGMFGFAAANSSRHGHWVAPWGGREGRLATNPLAYAVPTSGLPVVMDMSTSMISEGKIRILMQEGKPIPGGCVLDAQGNPVTEPERFYGPPKGTILPFGGSLGYKGFGLSLLVEILGSTLGGLPVTPDGEKDDYINGFSVIAVNPEAFGGIQDFKNNMDILCGYITSCPPAPGSKEVVMPGTYDLRMREKRLDEGIPVAEETWRSIEDAAGKVGVSIGQSDRK